MFLGGWQAAEGAMAWYDFLVIRQYHSMMGTVPACMVWLGNLGKNPRIGQNVKVSSSDI